MNKKIVIWLLTAALLSTALFVEAQQPKKVPRIGLLRTGVQNSEIELFRQGLRDLGYVEGQNVIIEYRFAKTMDQLPAYAADLVRLKVDVIVTATTRGVRAAKDATTTIPIVVARAGTLYVTNLARPEGNITGLTNLSQELAGKRLELLKETFPKVSRIAVLGWANSPSAPPTLNSMQAVAQPLGVKLHHFEVRDADQFDSTFSTIKHRADAVISLPESLFNIHRRRIIELAAKSRLPVMYHSTGWVGAGGLMAYSTNNPEMWRRAAVFVDRILKGAKPADLPVEQPIKFELVII